MMFVGVIVGSVWVVAVLLLAARGRVPAAIMTAAVVTAAVVLAVAEPGVWPLAGSVVGLVSVGSVVAAARHRPAGEVERLKIRWLIWGVIVANAVAGMVAILHGLLAWPAHPGAVALCATVAIPIGLILSSFDRVAPAVDAALVHTVVVVGLLGLVGATYLVVIVGLGRVPDEAERPVLALSMVAAGVIAVFVVPARRWLAERANEWAFGDRGSPDEALRTFGGRMSRAVPMDELLLQLAETLKVSMHLSAVEIWTGGGGSYERAVTVPDRPVIRLTLGDEELSVAARAHVQGNAWVQIWMPDLLADRDDRVIRMAAVAHLGELLGMIVVERPADGVVFADEEERVLTELARQVGLALHNVRLDSALQASLGELEVRNEELAASRLRIVTAADESRRRIERDLHDGAQQHLVALAVKVGLVKQLMTADPDTAQAFLDELRDDVQATLTELRDLAHGIYPPLLRDRGLAEALRTAANRSALPTDVVAEGLGRYPSEIEAAVYFCCLEAMQNAGKHAGDGSCVHVRVSELDGRLMFGVTDDGAGFSPDVKSSVVAGHGFVNMTDRLGAVGGVLSVNSAVGEGATVGGDIPLPTHDHPLIEGPSVAFQP